MIFNNKTLDFNNISVEDYYELIKSKFKNIIQMNINLTEIDISVIRKPNNPNYDNQ